LLEQQQIEELNEKIALLGKQRDKLETEAREWAVKRDRRNEQFKKLRDEIFRLRLERDEANEKVGELKLNRDEAKARVQQKIQEAKNLREEIRTWIEKKPSRTLRSLQQEFESIEWTIQTTSMSLQEEKELVEQVKQTETQLNVYKKLEQLRQRSLSLRGEIKTLRAQGQSMHDALTQIAQKSQEFHEKMLLKIEESKKIKADADSLHLNFLQTKRRTKLVQHETTVAMDQMTRLKGEVRHKEEEEKRHTEGAILSKLEGRAREKLKRGERLTWEEFQLLAEKGMDTEDTGQ
jgi:uncharacterized coiled-coil DUF342 family protein